MNIQVLEERAGEAKQHLSGNKRVLSSLGDFYRELVYDLASPLRDQLYQMAGEAFLNRINMMIGDIEAQVERLTILVLTTADRKSLVRIHNCRESRL